MKEDRTAERSQLCRTCGACCNGGMFAFVDVEPGELTPATRRRLSVIEERGVFSQPCPAWTATGCEVYADRPRRCHEYTCDLYRVAESGQEEHARLLHRARRIHELIAALQARRGARDGEWLPRAVSEMLSGLRPDRVEPELLLDVAELAMRLQRDLGWRPEITKQPTEAPGSGPEQTSSSERSRAARDPASD